ncbi:hypothetical protein ACN28C_02025 [Plantactinospora sp. WMMC1484]|uniref:hypothetical protein n=1 Tax=Plantactinospora sp. WMMC1484 TaxID=3404122 RepID=UPI003BF5FC53
MAPDRTPAHGDATLRPVRWSRPGTGSLLRWALVAALLALALGAFHLHRSPSSCPAPASTSGRAEVRPGDRVDLLATRGGEQAGRAPKPTILATRALVLDVWSRAGPTVWPVRSTSPSTPD